MSQPSWTVDTCCGCIDLRTGCLIIGYLSLVGEIIYIISGLVLLIGGSIVTAQSENDMDKNLGITLIAFAIVFLVIVLFMLSFTIVLLVGVHKNKKGHIKAYLICMVVVMVLGILVTLASFAGKIDVGPTISRIVGFLISIYFLLVIRSYYYKMDDRKPAVYNTA